MNCPGPATAIDELLSEFGLTLPKDSHTDPATLLATLRAAGARRTRVPDQETLFQGVFAMTRGDFSAPIQAAAPHAELGHALDVLRRQLRRDFVHNQQYLALLEAMPLQIIVAGPGGEIRERNALARAGWECPEGTLQALLGQPLVAGAPPVEVQQGPRTMLLSAGPIVPPSGEVLGWVCVGTDVSVQAQARAALERARQTAEQTVQAQAAFLGTISHEMRTPLSAIQGIAASLARTPCDQQAPLLDALASSSQALADRIEDALMLVQLEAGEHEARLEPVALRSFLHSLSARHAELAAAKGVTLVEEVSAELPRRLRLDPHGVRQVAARLLDNAVKFTEAGRIAIRLRQDAGALSLEVEDTGVGIQESSQGRLFDAFTQADGSNSRRFGGAGLGLAVCDRLVRALGGALSVRSAPGQGSRFTVRLPWEPVATATQTLAQATILVVDDNAINRLVAQRTLQAQGATVLLASSGAQALALLKAEPIDLVLMDCQMPEMDGMETTARHRTWEAESGRAPVPILALTASVTASTAEHCAAVGMDGVLHKPLTISALQEQLVA